jgi:hypothetical protein
MSKSFNKARRREERKKRSWHIVHIGKYRCCFWLVPLIPIIWSWEKVDSWRDKRLTWSDEKAQKVLDYLLPNAVTWVADEGRYCYNPNWRIVWTRGIRPQDKKWINRFELELNEFIKHKYENDKYIKIYEKDDYWNEWVYFVEKEK